jgi:type I restriction enzyme, S subunit
MTPDLLLAHFDRLADAPDAIPRLRRFILDLAVRGKLVPQDPNDEPAFEAPYRSRADTPRRFDADLERGIASLLETYAPRPPFTVPASWRWPSVSQVAECRLGKMLDRGKNRGTPRRYLRNVNVRWMDFDLSDVLKMNFEEDELDEFRLQSGDVLICEGGEPGRAAVWDARDTDIYFQKALHRVRFDGRVVPSWFVRVISLDAQTGRLKAFFTGTGIKHFTGKGLARYSFPLPPLAEQRRIVARVEELMALCDQLEATQAERERRRDRLVTASLHRLTEPPASDDRATVQDDARLTLDNLPRLVTRPEHVKQIRETILSLAVQGKLVPQDPNDEPASALLARIVALQNGNRGRSGRGGGALLNASGHAGPWTIPPSWVWASFGQVMISRDGERIPVSKDERSRRAKLYDYYGASGVIDKIDGYLFDKPLLLIGEDGANLINRSTPIAFIARGRYWVNNHAHVLDGITEDFLKYMELHINAIDLRPYVTGTAQPKMNQAKMNSIPIALPPENEQRRIVARVEELMALCDQLEAVLARGREDSRRLLEAALRDALGPTGIVRERDAAPA